MKKLALHWKILIGMALGVVFALLMTNFEFGKEFIKDWIKPFGTIFINSLKLIAIPLILAALIKGVSDLKDISKLSKMGGRTIAIYIVTTVIAVSIGLVLVNLIKPGNSISDKTRTELVDGYSDNTKKYKDEASKQEESGPLQALVDLVPQNIFAAATSNRNMLQVNLTDSPQTPRERSKSLGGNPKISHHDLLEYLETIPPAQTLPTIQSSTNVQNLNENFEDINLDNNFVCQNIEVIDTSKIPCDLNLEIVNEKLFYSNKERVGFYNQLNEEIYPFTIEYWVEDLFENKIKNKVVTKNTNKKSYTPNIDEEDRVLYLKSEVKPLCNDSNHSNNFAEKMLIVVNNQINSQSGDDDSAGNSKIEIKKNTASGHYCIAFGIYAFLLGIPLEETLYAYYYNTAIGLVTNSVKLVPLGQLDGQDIMFRLQPIMEKLASETLLIDRSLVGMLDTGLDIRCMQHENLYSRLYMS